MFGWLKNLFTQQATRKKQKEEWAKYYPSGTPQNPNNNLPLDPKNDPWTT